jgi:hypothetical protein
MDTQLQPVQDSDLQQLPLIIKAWQENRAEIVALTAQLSEKKTRQKALDTVILGTMKKNEIGALDLKQSGGRLLFKQKTTKGGLSQKVLQEYLAEHLKSDESANKALAFIAEKRGTKGKKVETLTFEKL